MIFLFYVGVHIYSTSKHGLISSIYNTLLLHTNQSLKLRCKERWQTDVGPIWDLEWTGILIKCFTIFALTNAETHLALHHTWSISYTSMPLQRHQVYLLKEKGSFTLQENFPKSLLNEMKLCWLPSSCYVQAKMHLFSFSFFLHIIRYSLPSETSPHSPSFAENTKYKFPCKAYTGLTLVNQLSWSLLALKNCLQNAL